MTLNISAAANAYAAAQRLSPAKTDPTPVANPDEFGQMVKQAIENTVKTGANAETKAAEMVQGKADIVDVVTAVAETEVAVETLVGVRDKVISAYQEIMNMPI